MSIFRIFKIVWVLARNRLDRLIPDRSALPWGVRLALLPVRLLPTPDCPAHESLRLALQSLGPIFVKFGQLLSTRRDLFSNEVSDQLQLLQDQVPPFSSPLAMQMIESALGGSIHSYFMEFNSEPLASASVAQIHSATLVSGEDVIVKVLRPGIEKTINKDIALLHIVARFVERLWSEGSRLHLVKIVRDYDKVIHNELDLQLEAANTTQLRSNWEDSPQLYVPKVYWDLTRRNVMVMERIYGVRATNLDVLNERGTNLKKLAHLGVEIFFTQVFEHNFFHADMHPGNVYVDVSDPDNPHYIALDCAIIGSLSDNDMAYLAKNLLAFFNRKYGEIARLHIESGWVPADTDANEFEMVIRSVCEPVFEKPISEISFGRVLLDLFQTAQRFNMEIQPQLVLLQKTLLNIEGMGRQIYPELDLWATAKPFMEKWMVKRVGPGAFVNELRERASNWLDHLPEIPDLAYNAMVELGKLGEYSKRQSDMIAELQHDISQSRKRAGYARAGGVLMFLALIAITAPLSLGLQTGEALITSSVLGSLGLYWMYVKP